MEKKLNKIFLKIKIKKNYLNIQLNSLLFRKKGKNNVLNKRKKTEKSYLSFIIKLKIKEKIDFLMKNILKNNY